MAEVAFDHALDIVATPLDVRAALARVRHLVAPLELGADDRDTVELVIAEVLNNVVEHGYPDGTDDTILLRLASADRGLRVTITDRGRPMPDGRLPSTPAPEPRRLAVEKPEGGFGWFLVRQLTEDLAYCRRDDLNEVSFLIRVGSHPGSA